jgi:hypothetical protein
MAERVSIPAGPSACAQAASSKEAAYRIDYTLAAARNTRVVALDDSAEQIVRDAAAQSWGQARFYTATDPGHELLSMEGHPVLLADELEDSNTVILVSVTGENAEAVTTIGATCKERGIMTAALVVTPDALTSAALSNLRSHARVLLLPAEADDLVELLKATRA